MAKTKAKTKSKTRATAPKKRGRPAGKTTKKKSVRRKRSSVNIARVTAERRMPLLMRQVPREVTEAMDESEEDAVRKLGFGVEDKPGDEADVVSCPGTTTCRIGITNSQNFGQELAELVRNYEAKKSLKGPSSSSWVFMKMALI